METQSEKLGMVTVTVKEEPPELIYISSNEDEVDTKMEGTPVKKKRIHKPRTQEQKRRQNELRRLKRRTMTPEEKARDNARKKRKLVEATPEEREEMKAKRRFHLYLKRLERTDEERKAFNTKVWMQKQARLAQMTEEEKEEARRKNVENVHNYYKNLRGERLEKHKEMLRECARKKWREKPDELLEYFRRKVAEETPEKRKRRLRGYKINQRRRQMKKEMENEGILGKEEIERRLKIWVTEERGKPLSPVREEEISEYKPRLSGRKPKKNSKRFKEIYEGRPRSPPPPRGGRKRRSCWKLPVEKEEILAPSSSSSPPRPPSYSGGDLKFRMGSPPPSHQIIISNPLPSRFVPEEEKAEDPPQSPSTSFGGDYYPDPDSPPSPPQDIPQDNPEEEPPPPIQENELSPPSPPVTGPSSCSTWKCPLCPTSISSLSSLPNHFRLHHPLHPSLPKPIPSPAPPSTSKFQCILCPWTTPSTPTYLQFKKSSDLLEHVYLHHPSSYYPCSLCPLLLYSSSRLTLHLRQCSKTIPSKKSTKTFKSSKKFTNRTKSSKTPPPAPRICEDCGRTFKNNGDYTYHQRHSHPSKTQGVPLHCPKCPRICSHLRSFWLHFAQCGIKPAKNRAHTSLPKTDSRYSSDGPHPCFQCSKTFVQKATLDDHIRRDHLGQTHTCPLCHKNFQSAGKVWRHQVEYHGISPSDLPPPPKVMEAVNCKYCGLLIMRGYEQHVKKVHPEDLEDFRETLLPELKEKMEKAKRARSGGGGDKKLTCLFCPAILAESSLKRHMQTHHGVTEEWRCPDCNKVYGDQIKFEYHVAQVHAYQEMEEILKEKQLILDTKVFREGKRQVACKICGLEVPLDKYSVRVHFAISHYDRIKDFFDENGKKR